eukprot:RCo034244
MQQSDWGIGMNPQRAAYWSVCRGSRKEGSHERERRKGKAGLRDSHRKGSEQKQECGRKKNFPECLKRPPGARARGGRIGDCRSGERKRKERMTAHTKKLAQQGWEAKCEQSSGKGFETKSPQATEQPCQLLIVPRHFEEPVQPVARDPNHANERTCTQSTRWHDIKSAPKTALEGGSLWWGLLHSLHRKLQIIVNNVDILLSGAGEALGDYLALRAALGQILGVVEQQRRGAIRAELGDHSKEDLREPQGAPTGWRTAEVLLQQRAGKAVLTAVEVVHASSPQPLQGRRVAYRRGRGEGVHPLTVEVRAADKGLRDELIQIPPWTQQLTAYHVQQEQRVAGAILADPFIGNNQSTVVEGHLLQQPSLAHQRSQNREHGQSLAADGSVNPRAVHQPNAHRKGHGARDLHDLHRQLTRLHLGRSAGASGVPVDQQGVPV